MSTEPIQVLYCPVCEQPKRKLSEKLYGVPTCRRCIDGFTKRRSLAAAVDWVLLPVLYFPVATIVVGLVFIAMYSVLSDAVPESVYTLTLMFSWLVMFLIFCAKDAFSGYSPGKALCGLRAIHEVTGEPIGFWRSIARNIPPGLGYFLGLLIALQIRKGPRLGDGWAKSKVVWQKFADRGPFRSRGKGWVAEQADVQLTGATLPEDGNPFRAPQG